MAFLVSVINSCTFSVPGCVPGYAGGGNPNTCSPCPAGLYSNGGPVASTTCTACPAGYTTSGTGSTSADCTQVANAEGGWWV